jgi:Mor family transcriptional regulator
MSRLVPVFPLEDMQADLDQGMSVKETSKKYLTHPVTVYALIHQNKLTHVKYRQQCTVSLPLEDIQVDLDQDMSITEICKKYQTQPVTVYTLIYKNKLTKLTKLTHKLNQPRLKSIQKDLNKGIRVQIIARKHNVSKQYIYYLIGQKLLTKERERIKITKETIERLQSDIDAGMRLSEISKKHNVSLGSVYKYIRTKHLIQQNPNQQCLESIQTDLNQGMHVKDIARKYNVSVPNLYSLIRRNELKKPEVGNNSAVPRVNRRMPIADIQTDLNHGMSLLEISEKYNIYTSSLYALFRKGTLIKPLSHLVSSTRTNKPFAPTKMW